ncbi:hypothetical protein ASD81_04705 [Nocardioides sp. Root614]|nr:hypothetical protein ASD81_04705 [Nocardioides sp. Root614]KRA91946.1 hypothetical protein ASD84_04970 [Nocardioides sp. Root682]
MPDPATFWLNGLMRYADPALCPDCRSPLPAGVPVCPTCQLLVRHPLAVDLFRTLRRADDLVVELRTASTEFHGQPAAPAPAAASVPAHTTAPAAGQPLGGPLVPPGGVPATKRAVPPPPGPPAPPAPPLPSYPAAPVPPAPERRGVASASVPKILLGLGAFCLLVAAVIFLAVSWSALGVGGRTAVLAGLTLTAGASALLLHRAGLRIAGESLIVVALGLLALDVFGAGASGWLGDGGDGVTACVAGLVVAAAGIVIGLLRIGGEPRLVAPQVIAGIGTLVGYFGAANATEHLLVAGHVFTALALGIVLLARSQDLPVLAWSQAFAGAFAWLGASGVALADALSNPDLHQLWIDGSGWSLLVSAAVLLAPGVILHQRGLLLAGASCAAMVMTVVVTLPCVDTDTTTVGLVAVAVTAAWVLGLALLPRSFRTIAIAPSAVGSVILVGFSVTTAAVAFARWADLSTGFERRLDLTIGGTDPVTEPLLLVPSLVVPIAFLALLASARRRDHLVVWAQVAAITAGIGTAATLASYDVTLALPVSALVVVALGAMVAALTSSGGRAAGLSVSGTLTATAASIAAVPSAPMTAIVAGLATASAIVLALRGTQAVRLVGALSAAPFFALATSATVYAASGDAAWIAIPVLLAVGVLALALPRPEIELPAVMAAVVTFPVSLAETTDAGGYTALWLTVAGFLFCATALIHESRRFGAWIGAALLLLATWVRLADLDVEAPEAYTLPLALALIGFGLWRMQKAATVGTAEALLPGLLLGTVPSLLWVLNDPVSIRALLLGGACLALTLAGAALRWSAPLMVGATVGAIVVFREIGPYAGDFPKWVWIGLAGALLTIVGITWERQLLEVRKAVGYLGRLR